MKITAVIGGLLLATQIVLLVIQLHVLHDSYGHIRSQDAKAARLYPLQRSSAQKALPVLRDARLAINPIRRGTGQLVRATETLPDLITSLQQTIQDVHVLRGMTQRSLDLQHHSVDLQQGSLQIQEASLQIQQRSLRAQQQSLAIQRRAVAVLLQSRGIQRETLQHARNLDNKTGGGLTTP